jgi:hypothetical protein
MLHLFGLLAQLVCQVTHVGLFEMLDGGNEMFEPVCRCINVITMMRVAVFVVMFVVVCAMVIAVLIFQPLGDFSDFAADAFQLVTLASSFQVAGMTVQFFEVPP